MTFQMKEMEMNYKNKIDFFTQIECMLKSKDNITPIKVLFRNIILKIHHSKKLL